MTMEETGLPGERERQGVSQLTSGVKVRSSTVPGRANTNLVLPPLSTVAKVVGFLGTKVNNGKSIEDDTEVCPHPGFINTLPKWMVAPKSSSRTGFSRSW